MRKTLVFLLAAAGFALVIARPAAQPGQVVRADLRPVPAHAPSHSVLRGASRTSDKALIEQYCLDCHDSDKAKGDLVLETFDPAKADQRADVAEKMIRKLRAGMMPPAGGPRRI